jgi:hypothetical protein
MKKKIAFILLNYCFAAAAEQPATTPKIQFNNHVSIEVRGEYRYIVANGIPDHQTGDFPNRHNPNSISEQKYEFRMPLHPKVAEKPTPAFGPSLFGVALNGVPFDPGTAEMWNNDPAWRIEAMTGHIDLGIDQSNAHVQPNGAYHYHALPTGMIDKISVDKQKMLLVGYAADGFPIYSQYGYNDPNDLKSGVRKMKSSYRLKEGVRPGGPGGKYDGKFTSDFEYVKGLGDLDECNGRTGVTPEYPQGSYHYYITEEFPIIARMHRGEPDPSFQKRGPGPGRGLGRGPPGGPGFGPPPPRRD